MKIKSLFAIALACLFASSCSLLAELNAEPEKEPEAKLAVYGDVTQTYYTDGVIYEGIVENVGDATAKLCYVTITLYKNDVKVDSGRTYAAGGENLAPGEKGAFDITIYIDDPRNAFDRWGIGLECFTVN